MENTQSNEEDGSTTKVDEYENQLDIDELLADFMEYMGRPETTRVSRGKRFLYNYGHMMMTVATAGLWPLMYGGYYLYDFNKRVTLDDYRYDVKVEKSEREEEK